MRGRSERGRPRVRGDEGTMTQQGKVQLNHKMNVNVNI